MCDASDNRKIGSTCKACCSRSWRILTPFWSYDSRVTIKIIIIAWFWMVKFVIEEMPLEHYYTTQAVSWPRTKINQSNRYIIGPYWTIGQFEETIRCCFLCQTKLKILPSTLTCTLDRPSVIIGTFLFIQYISRIILNGICEKPSKLCSLLVV